MGTLVSRPASRAAAQNDDVPTLVVFDAMGVLYSIGNDVGELLIPYLRELGCVCDNAEIRRWYRQASLGQISSARFWKACGVQGDDVAFTLRHTLTPGIVALVTDLHRHGVRMACLSNDVSEWSLLLRQRFGLDRFIDTWMVSGDIGVRKPHEEAFQILAETTGTSFSQMVFFDDRPDNVEAARGIGIDAIQFISASLSRKSLCARYLLPASDRT